MAPPVSPPADAAGRLFGQSMGLNAVTASFFALGACMGRADANEQVVTLLHETAIASRQGGR